MTSRKLFSSPSKPDTKAAITVKLSEQVHERVVREARLTGQTVAEWIEDMCHTATID